MSNIHAHPETVRIKAKVTDDNPDGVVIINKSDFVEGEMELADAPAAPAKAEAEAPAKADASKPWEQTA